MNGVPFLKANSVDDGNLFVGSGTTLSDTILLFRAVAQKSPATFKYLSQLADHIEKVAHPHVRNVSFAVGNFLLKDIVYAI